MADQDQAVDTDYSGRPYRVPTAEEILASPSRRIARTIGARNCRTDARPSPPATGTTSPRTAAGLTGTGPYTSQVFHRNRPGTAI